MSLDWLNEQTAQKRAAQIVASERVVDFARLFVEHRGVNEPAAEYAFDQLVDALRVERQVRFEWQRAAQSAVDYSHSMQGDVLPFEGVQ